LVVVFMDYFVLVFERLNNHIESAPHKQCFRVGPTFEPNRSVNPKVLMDVCDSLAAPIHV
jgi:hypothetical protein